MRSLTRPGRETRLGRFLLSLAGGDMKKIRVRKTLKKLVKKAAKSRRAKKWGTRAAIGAAAAGVAVAGGMAVRRSRAKAKKRAAKKRPAAKKRKAGK